MTDSIIPLLVIKHFGYHMCCLPSPVLSYLQLYTFQYDITGTENTDLYTLPQKVFLEKMIS
jgi:hypothetical protein